MKYQFIEQYKQEFPVVAMCRVLEVCESVSAPLVRSVGAT